MRHKSARGTKAQAQAWAHTLMHTHARPGPGWSLSLPTRRQPSHAASDEPRPGTDAAPLAGLRTRGRPGRGSRRSRNLLAVTSQAPRPRRGRPVCTTAVVPTHRCGAVPVSHRVPSYLGRPRRTAEPAASDTISCSRTKVTPNISGMTGRCPRPTPHPRSSRRSSRRFNPRFNPRSSRRFNPTIRAERTSPIRRSRVELRRGWLWLAAAGCGTPRRVSAGPRDHPSDETPASRQHVPAALPRRPTPYPRRVLIAYAAGLAASCQRLPTTPAWLLVSLTRVRARHPPPCHDAPCRIPDPHLSRCATGSAAPRQQVSTTPA